MILLPGPVIPSEVREARDGFASHAFQAMNPSSSRITFRFSLPDLEGDPSSAPFVKDGLLRSNSIDSRLPVSKEAES